MCSVELSSSNVDDIWYRKYSCKLLSHLIITLIQIKGIQLTSAQRDAIRQGIDSSMSKEFIPIIDADLVSVRFVPVSRSIHRRDIIVDCYIVEIFSNALSAEVYTFFIIYLSLFFQVYQLSSGRVFLLDNSDTVIEAKSIMQVCFDIYK